MLEVLKRILEKEKDLGQERPQKTQDRGGKTIFQPFTEKSKVIEENDVSKKKKEFQKQKLPGQSS